VTDTHDSIRAIQWTEKGLCLLDQRVLPSVESYQTLAGVDAVIEAIRNMVVRGAPAIGITAAYGVVLAAQSRYAQSPTGWRPLLERDIQALATARPTAVNLAWALQRMQQRAQTLEGDPVSALLAEARQIHEEDIAANYRMGEYGAGEIAQGASVLTYCNTGSLATGGYGTALGVIRSAWHAGKLKEVYASETRPWLQGARLTAWELEHDCIPVTLIADNAAAFLMQKKKVEWVIVGADRVTANGDVINKIGTYNLAVNCRYHGVGFMVVAPLSTLDMDTASGAGVVIEQRDPEEILSLNGSPVAAPGAAAWNPAFDITPAALVDCLITERGVTRSPDPARLAALKAG